jgi:hypothetical protein
MMRGDVAGSSGNGQFLRKACARGICVYAAFFLVCLTLQMRATLNLDSWYKLYSMTTTRTIAAELTRRLTLT